MKKNEVRFQLLFTKEEIQALKSEAVRRNITASELLRLSLNNEIYKKSSLEKLNALHELTELF